MTNKIEKHLWDVYEAEKREIARTSTSIKEYTRRIDALIKKLGI